MAIDKARAEALFELYGPAIFRRCTKLLRDATEAEDATQEVFLKVCRYLDRLRTGESGLPWVYRIATSVCLNRIRGRLRSEAARSSLAAGDTRVPFEERVYTRELLSRTDERTGLIAAYHLVDGMSQEEIADALGISRRTVYTRLQKFLAMAKELS